MKSVDVVDRDKKELGRMINATPLRDFNGRNECCPERSLWVRNGVWFRVQDVCRE